MKRHPEEVTARRRIAAARVVTAKGAIIEQRKEWNVQVFIHDAWEDVTSRRDLLTKSELDAKIEELRNLNPDKEFRGRRRKRHAASRAGASMCASAPWKW